MKTDASQHIQDISKKLNVLIAISIRILLENKDFITDKKHKKGSGILVHYLADMGLDSKDIAEILGAPLSSVRTLMTPKRRK
jgi:hypothetical protein